MQAIGGGVLDLVVFLLVVAFALALLFFVERRRGHGARELEALAAPLELRLRKSGHRLIPLPEDFILHERLEAGSDSCRVEHRLIGSDASLLPAIFGYVTYRDRMKGQRMGYPLLCLAVPAVPETPDFSLHRHKLREWIRAAGWLTSTLTGHPGCINEGPQSSEQRTPLVRPFLIGYRHSAKP